MGIVNDLKYAFGLGDTQNFETIDDVAEVIEERGVTAPPPPVAYPPARSYEMSVEQALSIGAVYRSVQIISTNVSQMQVGVFRDGVQIDTPTLIKTPQVGSSMTAFLEETVFSMAVHGNAYWRVYRGSNGQVSSLEVLDPTVVGIRREKNKKVYYIGDQDFAPQDIKHLKLTRRPGHDLGYGPLQINKGEIHAALTLRAYSDAWFDVKGVPTGILTTDMNLNADEAKAYKEAFEAFSRSGGGTVVMSQGMRYEPVAMNPKDSNFVEVQREAVKTIARLFGVPAIYLMAEMSGSSMTYTNMQDQILSFVQNTLTRYLNEIEQALSECLPRGQEVQFIEESLLRMDVKSKWEVIGKQVEVGYTNGDEIRADEGKEPLPKVDAPTPAHAYVNKEDSK